jgi:protein SCO1
MTAASAAGQTAELAMKMAARGGRRMVVAVALIGLLTGCSVDVGSQPLPAFSLTNQRGQLVRAEALRGQTVIISFIFTTCQDVCPLVTSELARVQAELQAAGPGPAVRFVSITVDPATDTPEVLQRYADRFGIETATWDFLTGTQDEIGRVVREVGLWTTKDRGRVGHQSLVLVVDSRGQIVQRYADVDHLSARILDRIRTLQRTARR